MTGTESLRSPWTGLVPLCAVLLVFLVLFWPGAVSLATLWSDSQTESYTHGFLIAAIAAWLLWQRAPQFAPAMGTAPRGWRLAGLLLLAGSALVWQFALRAGIQVAYLSLLPVLLAAGVALLLGPRALRAAAFPLGFLYFAMPVWDYVNPLLHWLTIHVVRIGLRLVGIPSFFSGDLVQIPAGMFEIQGGCSGLHYVIVGLAIAVLLGELRQDPWRERLRWIVVGGALAIVSNWVRVFSIIVMGHLTHMQSYLVRVSHYSYGWFVFMGALGIFFWYVARRARPASAAALVAAPAAPQLARAGIAPGLTVATLIIAAVPTVMNLAIGQRLPDAASLLPRATPVSANGWQPAAAVPLKWQPVQQGADREIHWTFTRGGDEVQVYAAGYLEQRQRKKLGGRANLPGGERSTPLAQGGAEVAGRHFETSVVQKDSSLASIWRIYQVDDRWFTSANRAQFFYSVRAMRTLRSPPSRVWIFRAACADDCAAADRLIGAFIEQYGELLWPEGR
jgi:exosortase